MLRNKIKELILSSGFVLRLDSSYYVFSKNIISISCLDFVGFNFIIKDKCYYFYRDGVFNGCSYMKKYLYILEIQK